MSLVKDHEKPRPPRAPRGEAARASRVETLKSKIMKGMLDADGLVDGILDEILREAV